MIVDYPIERRMELLKLFENHPYLQLLSEVLLKEGLGEAYVDNLDNPMIVLLSHMGVIFLSGNVNNPLIHELLERVPEKNIIFVPPRSWEEKIKEYWGEKLKPYPRTQFSSDGLDTKYMREILNNVPERMIIEKVTMDSIHQISGGAKGDILLCFPSLEKFMEKNFGFLIRDGDTIVSLALAVSPLYRNEFAIHIETHPDYQKRGLAMISAAALILYSLENEMVPHWDADNPPSAKLATKLGFTKPEPYNAYYWVSEDVVQPWQ